MIVLRAVAFGLLSKAEALERYELSEEEFDQWCRAFEEQGAVGLKVSQRRRE